MAPVARFLGALVTGLVAGGGIMLGAEELAGRLPPGPGGVRGDPAAFAATLADVPAAPALLVLAGWGLGALAAGALASGLVARRRALIAVVTGLVFVAVTVLRLVTRPHPFVFSAVALASVMAGAAAARGIALRREGR
jgi:hypothetical protein